MKLSYLRGLIKFSSYLHQSKLGGSSLKLELSNTYDNINQTGVVFDFDFNLILKSYQCTESNEITSFKTILCIVCVQLYTCFCFAL